MTHRFVTVLLMLNICSLQLLQGMGGLTPAQSEQRKQEIAEFKAGTRRFCDPKYDTEDSWPRDINPGYCRRIAASYHLPYEEKPLNVTRKIEEEARSLVARMKADNADAGYCDEQWTKDMEEWAQQYLARKESWWDKPAEKIYFATLNLLKSKKPLLMAQDESYWKLLAFKKMDKKTLDMFRKNDAAWIVITMGRPKDFLLLGGPLARNLRQTLGWDEVEIHMLAMHAKSLREAWLQRTAHDLVVKVIPNKVPTSVEELGIQQKLGNSVDGLTITKRAISYEPSKVANSPSTMIPEKAKKD